MKKRTIRKKAAITLAIALVLIGGIIVFAREVDAPSGQHEQSPNHENVVTPVGPANFDKTRYSLSEPSSPWVVVNKARALPSSYAPADLAATKLGGSLRKEAATALDELIASAKQAGISLSMISAYRSYATQVTTYNAYVAQDGQAAADTYSARPGHSEHQTGWAADLGNGICDLETCFGDTRAGKWLAEHAYEYGFIIRYPKGKEAITGYQYEPWHLRYVGRELAAELHRTGQTMEEFFNIVPNPQPY